MASTHWEEIVRLAQEVEADCRRGTLDPERVAHLAVAVVEFQRALVTVRPHTPSSLPLHPEAHAQPAHHDKGSTSDGG